MANYGELGYLLAQRRAGMGNPGAASLGYLLGGGGRAQEQQIFNRSALEGARMQDALAQARQRTQQNIGREGLAAREEKNGDSELAAIIRAGGTLNPNEIAQYRQNSQKTQFSKDAWAARNGDPNALNRMLMVIQGKPVEFQHSLGEGQYTPNAYDTNSKPITTDIGRARVSEIGALMQEHNAQAGAAKALQDQRAGKAPDATKSKPFTVGEMSAAFGDGQHIDPEKFTRFQAYRKNAPSDTDAFLQMHDDDQQAAQMGPPSDLAPPKPGILDSISSLFGGGKQSTPTPAASAKPNLQDWLTKAKQANPGVSDDELTAYYNKKYGG